MRILEVHIKSKFKNLKDFRIEFDKEAMETVLIGLNATGKSNFMEALVIIFRDLDLERSPQHGKSRNLLEYYIKYECRGKTIEIKFSIIEGYSFIIDNVILKSRPAFFREKEIFLPKHVFIYYSGLSTRLTDLYSEHEKAYYSNIINSKAKYKEFDSIRRIFLVQNIHASFALIAFFMNFGQKIEEEETKQFLKDELKIHDFGSALFIIKKPTWARPQKDIDEYWGADGLVKRFLDDLRLFALAPIYNEERIQTNYKKAETQSHYYLYLSNKKVLQDLVDLKYQNKTQLFNALESIYLSDLLFDVKITIEKEYVNKGLSMSELSEGEKQLLTVLGLLKFTKDEESLILLDEPDTHLNPLWKWKYLEYLDKVVKNPKSTQIIFSTHDPLVIGGMDKKQVRVFKQISLGKTMAIEPDKSPKGMGVAGILTSDLFGLPTILDKETQEKLNRKRYLQGKLMRDKLSQKDYLEYNKLKAELEELGFYEEVEDQWFKMYLAEMSRQEIMQKVEYTEEEKLILKNESEKAIERVKQKIQDNQI